ncbi:hypothetical protein H4W32_008879 [Actinophytocola algeriensis]|nr:hypothetical protein [Actinophytocola algeriensis]
MAGAVVEYSAVSDGKATVRTFPTSQRDRVHTILDGLDGVTGRAPR